MAGDIVEWVQEDVTEYFVEDAKEKGKEKTADTEKAVASMYSKADISTSSAAENAVRNAAIGSGLSQRDIDTLAGTASKESSVAHSVGRGLVDSSKGVLMIVARSTRAVAAVLAHAASWW